MTTRSPQRIRERGLVASLWIVASLWLAAALATVPALAAEAPAPRLQDVLSAVTLSFGTGGAFDRAVLTQGDDGADLAIYRNVPAPGADAALLKPDVVKRELVWSGQMWGTLASLSVNGRGSLVIASANDAIGRDRWSQTLTVVLRDGAYIIVGITHTSRDTLDPHAGTACDFNLLTGKGTANGKPVAGTPSPIKLQDWSDDKLPKVCGG